MKPYKTVIYSFLVGGTFALIAQAILTFWQTVLVGTPMAFFMGGATLISMGVIGCILGGLACYQYVEEWATFGALLPFSGFAMAVGMKAVGPWTKNNEKMGKCIWNCVWFVVWFNVLFAAICNQKMPDEAGVLWEGAVDGAYFVVTSREPMKPERLAKGNSLTFQLYGSGEKYQDFLQRAQEVPQQ